MQKTQNELIIVSYKNILSDDDYYVFDYIVVTYQYVYVWWWFVAPTFPVSGV